MLTGVKGSMTTLVLSVSYTTDCVSFTSPIEDDDNDGGRDGKTVSDGNIDHSLYLQNISNDVVVKCLSNEICSTLGMTL